MKTIISSVSVKKMTKVGMLSLCDHLCSPRPTNIDDMVDEAAASTAGADIIEIL